VKTRIKGLRLDFLFIGNEQYFKNRKGFGYSKKSCFRKMNVTMYSMNWRKDFYKEES
jgi:hypothetical protein